MANYRGGDFQFDLDKYSLDTISKLKIGEIRELYKEMEEDYETATTEYYNQFDWIDDVYRGAEVEVEEILANDHSITKSDFYKIFFEIERVLKEKGLYSKEVMNSIDYSLGSFIG